MSGAQIQIILNRGMSAGEFLNATFHRGGRYHWHVTVPITAASCTRTSEAHLLHVSEGKR